MAKSRIEIQIDYDHFHSQLTVDHRLTQIMEHVNRTVLTPNPKSETNLKRQIAKFETKTLAPAGAEGKCEFPHPARGTGGTPVSDFTCCGNVVAGHRDHGTGGESNSNDETRMTKL